jgi:alpha-tubulin suppressor-like RCC1 family protein
MTSNIFITTNQMANDYFKKNISIKSAQNSLSLSIRTKLSDPSVSVAGRKHGTKGQLPYQKKLEITDIEQKSFSKTIFSSNCHTKNFFCHTKYFGSGPPLISLT